ncbi:MAG: hypothetical protein WBP28_08525, partial [Nostocoides sp.]
EDIQNGGEVTPAYFTVRAAKELIGVDDTPMPSGPVPAEDLENLANDAIDTIGKKKHKKKPGASRRSLRAFLLTWGDLDGWSKFYNPTELAAQLEDADWEMFERVLGETNAFAAELRGLRSAPISA